MNDKPAPVNPWIAEVIMEYRQTHPDDYIRMRYQSFLQDWPGTSWMDFVAEVSLQYKTYKQPLIVTHPCNCNSRY
ncbi:MAG: hypothetical protein IJ151_04700 [Bacteroidales bacterium]|nr:hypothetical protein [Bacteroidales bacterium]